jgi:sulfate permease, SulP family
MFKITNNVKADLFGGLTAAVTALPLAIAFGVMVTNELGPEWASTGALAGLYGAIFTGFFASFLGGTPSQVTGPTGPMTTVLAGIVATIVARFGAHMEPKQILVAGFMTVLLAGIIQVGMGLMRLGGLVKYIPYPVTAGFMNGIAVIIFLGQLKPFLGSEDETVDAATTLVGVFTFVVIMVTPKLTKSVPGSLVGLGLGSALYYLIAWISPSTPLGPIVGEVPTALPSLATLGEMLRFPSQPIFSQLLPVILGSALSLAVLGAIDSLLTSVVADTVTKTRHDSNRELVGQGIGNSVAACFGGFAGAGATIRTLVNINAGGRGRLSGMFHGLCLLMVVVVLGSAAGKIPNVVLSGILMVTAYGMIDSWSKGLLLKLTSAAENRSELLMNLGLVATVTVVTVVVDLMVAVGIGVLLASLYFVAKSSTTVIRGIYSGRNFHSRRVYPHHHQEVLEQHGAETLIIELQGPLFFGSADYFLRVAEDRLEPEVKRVIVDLSRVTGIDASGGRALTLFQETLRDSQRQLAISGLKPDSYSWGLLQDTGVVAEIKKEYFFPDLDRAREWSEILVLTAEEGYDGSYDAHELRTFDVFEHLTDEEFVHLEAALESVEFAEGDHVFRQGNPAESMYFIAEGRVHMYPSGVDNDVRLANFGPGAVVGEVSLFMGTGRTTNLLVDQRVKAYELSRAAMEKLSDEHPHVVVKLLRTLGRELAHRLVFLRDERLAVESEFERSAQVQRAAEARL